MAAQSILPFSVSLDLAKNVDLSRSVKRARDEAAKLRGNNIELLTILERRDDLDAAKAQAAIIARDFDEVFLLGTGGSSLGTLALQPLAKGGPKIRVFDNLDPISFGDAVKGDLSRTHVLAISKSGGTPETLMQVLTLADALKKSGRDLKTHFTIVTEDKKSALKSFGQDIGCAILDHPLGIGGRYSVLSTVGMLPAFIMGLDGYAFRKGAKAVADACAVGDAPPISGAALHAALGDTLQETILWSYGDRLKDFGAWWRQLWGESLGKEGKGTTPVAALGPVDQHSQLQLFLDGPEGKLFSFVDLGTKGLGPKVPREAAEKLGLSYLADKAIGDLVAAQVQATPETLAKRGRPVRVFHVGKLDEAALGALFMHFMLETILMGQMMGVDPFDQPAVEEGKILARAYLERS